MVLFAVSLTLAGDLLSTVRSYFRAVQDSGDEVFIIGDAKPSPSPCLSLDVLFVWIAGLRLCGACVLQQLLVDLEQGEEVDFLPAAAPGLLLLIGLDAVRHQLCTTHLPMRWIFPTRCLKTPNSQAAAGVMARVRIHNTGRKNKMLNSLALPMLPLVNNKRGIHDDDDDDGALMDVAGRRRQ